MIGSVAAWVDDGLIWVASDYADGWSLISIDPMTETVTHDGPLSDAVLSERAELIGLYIRTDAAKGKPSWWKCARWVAGTVIACAAARPLGCVGGAIQMACSCVPKLTKEDPTITCPWD